MQVTSDRATMRLGRRRVRAFLGLVAVGAVLFSLSMPTNSLAYPTGIAESKEGCICHQSTGPAARAVLLGLPDAGYEPGKEYELTIQALDGIPVQDPPQKNRGGFALSATAGTLEPVDNTTHLREGPDERKDLTHTEVGNDQREWKAKWKAPAAASGAVSFYLAVNTVNGDADGGSGGTTGDSWATSQFQATPATGGGGPGPTPPTISLGPISPGAGAALLFGGLSLLFSIYALTLPFRERSPYKEIDVSKVKVETSRPKRK